MTTETANKSFRYQEVSQSLLHAIKTNYRSGQMLDSERDLSKKYNVSHTTIRKVLEQLSQDGFVERHHGRGTVVTDRNMMGEMAIVVRPQLLNSDITPYYSVANAALLKFLDQENHHWKVNIHIGKETATGEEFPRTLDLLTPSVLKNLRGVFTHHRLLEVKPELDAAKIPVVMMGCYMKSLDDYNYVAFDANSLYSDALRHIKDIGCGSVGFLGSRFGATISESKVIQLASTMGLNVRPHWIAQGEANINEQIGYEAFMRFWSQSEHPDAVVIEDDIFCRGVLRAILHLGLHLPKDLKLVTEANKGVGLYYHLPVTRVEYDPQEQAKCAVEMMVSLLTGQEPESRKILLSGKLIKGETT